MAIRTILTIPDRRLTAVCRPVPRIDEALDALCSDLLDTLAATANGIGLAAPQIGTLLRVSVVDRNLGRGERDSHVLINPRIVERSEERIESEEGCLSIPGYYARVERHRSVTVEYLDRGGKECRWQAEGFLAVCLQHECDHLDGVLFIDYLSALKRSMAQRRTRKWQREHQGHGS